MFAIDVDMVRYSECERKAKHYGIGNYRRIPGKRKLAGNAARIGVVKRLKDDYKSKSKKRKFTTELGNLDEMLV